MARYSLFIKPSALKEIEKIDSRDDRRRIIRRIKALAEEPRPPGCEKLSGADRYRVRQGNYRIVYAVEDQRLVVYVIKVGNRKDVYR